MMDMATTGDTLVRTNKIETIDSVPTNTKRPRTEPLSYAAYVRCAPVVARVQQRRHCAPDRVGRTPLHGRRIVPHTLDALPRVLGAARLLLGDRRVVVA